MAAAASTPVRTEDFHEIDQLLSRYCWCFDDGAADSYVALWTGAGRLTGFGEPVEGMDAIRKVLTDSFAGTQGKLRHVLTNLVVRYGKDQDKAVATGYNLVISWQEGGKLVFNVLQTFNLCRTTEGWRVVSVDLNLMS